jgi:hypothetical protein
MGRHGQGHARSRRGKLGLVVACALLGVMGVAGVAVAAVTSDSAKGNGSLDNGNGTFDSFSVYAKSGSTGEKPSGSVFVDFVAISRQTGATLGNGTVRGDVGGGCLFVSGNRAAVLGKLREPATISGPGRIEYAGVTLEDNGPSGDRAEVWLFQGAANAAYFCAGGFFTFGFWRTLSDGYVEVVDS